MKIFKTTNNTLSFALFLPYIKTVFKCTKICGNEIGIKWPVWVIYAEVIFQSGKTHCRGVNAVKFKRLNHFNFYCNCDCLDITTSYYISLFSN
jgi:hypothetical protein